MYTTYIDTMKKKKKNPNKYEMKTWIDLAKKTEKVQSLSWRSHSFRMGLIDIFHSLAPQNNIKRSQIIKIVITLFFNGIFCIQNNFTALTPALTSWQLSYQSFGIEISFIQLSNDFQLAPSSSSSSTLNEMGKNGDGKKAPKKKTSLDD